MSKGSELKIEGSWAGRGIVRALAWEFQSTPNRGVISFLPRDSLQVVPLLAHDKLAMGLVLDSEVPSVNRDLGLEFQKYTLGRFVLVVIINGANSTRRITLEELAQVYQGRIQSWRELRNSAYPGGIELYAPLLAKTEGCVFRAKVLKDAPYAEQLRRASRKTDRQKRSPDDLIEAVARDRSAIGFMLYGREETKMDARVRVLAIAKDANSQPVLPSVRTVQDGSYPLSDKLSFYLNPHAPPMAKEFCDFATSLEAAKIVKPFRLFSECAWQQQADKARLAGLGGKAGPIEASGTAAGTTMMRDLAAAFSRIKTDARLQYHPTTPTEAIKGFLDHTELLFVEGSLSAPNLGQYASQWETQRPQVVPLGRATIGLIVHPTNRVHTLSMEDLTRIYTGQLLDWSDINPQKSLIPVDPQAPVPFPPAPVVKTLKNPIRLYVLPPANPLEPLFREKLGLGRLGKEVTCQPDTSKMVMAVAKDINAIGFVDVSQLPSTSASVKLLKLLLPDKQFAVSARDRNGQDYPLARSYTLYASPRASESTKEFVKFLTSGRAAEVIAKNGLLPAIVANSSVSALTNAVDSRLEKIYSKKPR